MISEFPLFVFTTLAGLAAGAYAVSAVFPIGKDAKKAWLLPLVCLALLAVGLVGCLGHLARPLLFANALANPAAGIAQEAYWSIAFGALLLADVALLIARKNAPRALAIIGAIAAVGLMLSMGCAYLRSYGVPAWSSPATVALFVLGDLAMGAAFLTLFAKELYRKRTYVLTTVTTCFLAAVSFVAEAIHFANEGLSALPFVGAIALLFAAIILVVFAAKRETFALSAAGFTCVFVGACVARFAFYAAGV